MVYSEAAILENRLNPPDPGVVVNVTVEPATTNVSVTCPRLDAFQDGTITADGTEQDLLEFTEVGRVMGYLDLQNMQAGDTLVIRQYMKLKTGGSYKKYAEEQYSGVQDVPVVYLKPKESDIGMKITIEQTAGVLRDYDYNFVREK